MMAWSAFRMAYKKNKNITVSVILALLLGPAGLFYCCTSAAVLICCVTLFAASTICIIEVTDIFPGIFFITALKILALISYSTAIVCSIVSTVVRNKEREKLDMSGSRPGMTVREERNIQRQKKILFKMKEKGLITQQEYEKGIRKLPD